MRHILREQSAVEDHLVGCVAVPRRVEVIEAMCQHGHRVHVVFQCIAVCMDVNAISQPADDQRVGAQPTQIRDEATDEILSVGGAMTCADYRDDMLPVEVCLSLVEEHEWRIRAFCEPFRVFVVVHAQHLYVVLPAIGQFLHGSGPHSFGVHQVFSNALRQTGKGRLEMIALPDDLSGGAQLLIELHHRVEMEVAEACEDDGVDDFLVSDHA